VNAPSSRELLARLVAFPTVSRDSNLPLVDWAEDYLTRRGARCRRSWSDDGTKANLLATFGPPVPGGLVLSGHTDVVPAGEPEWSSDPFRLREEGGRLHGRGTADMKGFIASAMARADDLGRRPLVRPVHLALSYDEEVGCLGAPRMIADMIEAGLRPELVVVGEPTGMQPAHAHKSVNLFRTEIRGVEAHSSQPHLGAGAILAAGRLVEALWRWGEEAREEADPAGGFEPPWTTVQVGLIEGGTAANILPGQCAFTWEYRSLPGEDPDRLRRRFQARVEEEVLPALREFGPSASITTRVLARVPPLLPEEDGLAEARVRAALEGRLEDRNVPPLQPTGVVAYGTEAGQFQAEGISAVLCGPGSIDQAHRPNEFLEVAQLEACDTFLHRLLAAWE
jgi:acetylornithine deacetylase